ncbi:hypothetical protein BEP19_12560 [Ammoniphilus oxalaticus]|uniref:Putative manganese efflux pump MntP n=1 Tax=Ammoniphilus oxalaticus TaxID=66863 RepID=A0A419SGW1_9BACL|nr:manganese efflux pump MntP family protein [Ammoniphilus oxalaticus]RKD23051.1 hypothetical protein BEP19_12560 [Ammoniphilus oxalaticus]
MEWDIVQWGQFYTVLMIGLALGMDAFSMGLGMGIMGIRLKTIAKISLIIGFFHILMPLLGIAGGIFLSTFIGDIATLIGGVFLCFLGANMLWGSFFRAEQESQIFQTGGFGLIIFALIVSLDALSVGFSFGLFDVDMTLAVLVFGAMGMIMAAAGLLLGKKLGDRISSHYGEAMGGAILLAFGLKFLL